MTKWTPGPRGPITRRQLIRGGTGLAGLFAVGGLVSACGSDDAPSPSGSSATANATGPIIMVNYPGWIGKTEVADFKTETGIEVKEVTGLTDGGTASQAAQLARNQGQYDMALTGNVLGRNLEMGDLIQEVNFDNIPNREGVDAKFIEEYPWGIPIEFGRLGIAYRKDLLSTPPQSWEELFAMAPQMSGQFTFPDYDVDVLSMAILALGYDINTSDPEELAAAGDLLIETKPYLKAFLATNAAKPLIEGSVKMAALHDYEMSGAMKANKDIGWVEPEEGMPSYLDGWLALKGTEQTGAVEKFMNFHLEPEVYASFINATGASWLLPAAEQYIDEDILNNPALKLSPDVNLQWEGFIDAEGTKLRNATWDEVKAS